MEFQRKTFRLKNSKHWKATQHRFIVLYTLSYLLKLFITTDKLKHLFLSYVRSRILFSERLAVKYKDYADTFLKNFLKLLPGFMESLLK